MEAVKNLIDELRQELNAQIQTSSVELTAKIEEAEKASAEVAESFAGYESAIATLMEQVETESANMMKMRKRESSDTVLQIKAV
jgi:chromosome segregation ATPase